MQHNKLTTLFGLKWNPFYGDIPREGLIATENIERFAWKVENLTMDGGFALITGDPGYGKSIALRLVFERIAAVRDVSVGVFSRPQSNIADFYRELGHLFGVDLKASNRFGGYISLRNRWKRHLETSQFRPVLFIDEAQEMPAATLNELRLLASMNFDCQTILTIILAGDGRLTDRFRLAELAPLGSRMRTRLLMEPKSSEDMIGFLRELISRAGNPALISDGLMRTLADHSGGNYRVLATMAHELLSEAVLRDRRQLDEDLFFDVYKALKRTVKKTPKTNPQGTVQ